MGDQELEYYYQNWLVYHVRVLLLLSCSRLWCLYPFGAAGSLGAEETELTRALVCATPGSERVSCSVVCPSQVRIWRLLVPLLRQSKQASKPHRRCRQTDKYCTGRMESLLKWIQANSYAREFADGLTCRCTKG